MNDEKVENLTVAKVYVIGVARWKYEYSTIDDAIACIHRLSKEIEEQKAHLDMFEVMVEFTSGESERCAYREEVRVAKWLRRFET